LNGPLTPVAHLTMMRIDMKILAPGVLALGLATPSMADEITIALNGVQSCNWGQLTRIETGQAPQGC
jgi:hypothetical protein